MVTWPQWFFVALLVIGLVYNLYQDGKKGSLTGAFASLMVIGMQAVVLYYGGFWSVWGIAP